MKKLPRDLPAKKIIVALERAGFTVDRRSGKPLHLNKRQITDGCAVS
jgi:predicted RNA binding protein YcfA (HicA-like mRNA interferase family)